MLKVISNEIFIRTIQTLQKKQYSNQNISSQTWQAMAGDNILSIQLEGESSPLKHLPAGRPPDCEARGYKEPWASLPPCWPRYLRCECRAWPVEMDSSEEVS